MVKKQVYLGFVFLVAMSLVIGLGLSGCAGSPAAAVPAAVPPAETTAVQTTATQAAVIQTTPQAPVAAESTPTAGKAGQEGIQVHGHWTIEVTNPDGSLVERQEFDNAITDQGIRILGQVLARQSSIGGWSIILSANLTADQAFVDALGNPVPMGAIVEPSFNVAPEAETNKSVFKTLTLRAGGAGQTFTLSGTALAGRTGKIEKVSTGQRGIPGNIAPAPEYPPSWFDAFTSTTLPSDKVVNLTAGQQVTVTVVISFS